MDLKVVLTAIVFGAMLGVIFGSGSLAPPVNADRVCDQQFGDAWSGKTVDVDMKNQSATLECTNGTATETISIDINAGVTVG